MRVNEMAPYRVTELDPPLDRRNFIVKRYEQTWLERQWAKVDRLWSRLGVAPGDAVRFEPPFCWKCKAHWPDVDLIWSCPNPKCTAIDRKALERWTAREKHNGGGLSSGSMMMLMLGAGMLMTRTGRKILKSWGRK